MRTWFLSLSNGVSFLSIISLEPSFRTVIFDAPDWLCICRLIFSCWISAKSWEIDLQRSISANSCDWVFLRYPLTSVPFNSHHQPFIYFYEIKSRISIILNFQFIFNTKFDLFYLQFHYFMLFFEYRILFLYFKHIVSE